MAWTDSIWLKNKIVSKLVDINTGLINKLSSNENNIKVAIGNTQTAIINNDNSNKNTLVTKVDNVKSVVDTIKSDVNTSKTNISSLTDKVTTLTNTVNTINTTVNTVKTEVTEVKQSVGNQIFTNRNFISFESEVMLSTTKEFIIIDWHKFATRNSSIYYALFDNSFNMHRVLYVIAYLEKNDSKLSLLSAINIENLDLSSNTRIEITEVFNQTNEESVLKSKIHVKMFDTNENLVLHEILNLKKSKLYYTVYILTDDRSHNRIDNKILIPNGVSHLIIRGAIKGSASSSSFPSVSAKIIYDIMNGNGSIIYSDASDWSRYDNAEWTKYDEDKVKGTFYQDLVLPPQYCNGEYYINAIAGIAGNGWRTFPKYDDMNNCENCSFLKNTEIILV